MWVWELQCTAPVAVHLAELGGRVAAQPVVREIEHLDVVDGAELRRDRARYLIVREVEPGQVV